MNLKVYRVCYIQKGGNQPPFQLLTQIINLNLFYEKNLYIKDTKKFV
jgi:hypothetical protein